MTKVAICFSGLSRLSCHLTISKWQEYIEKYNADVFIHTWISDANDLTNNRHKLVDLFNPIVLKYEPPRIYPLQDYQERVWWSVVVYNVFSAYTSLYESTNLAIQYANLKQFKYDYIIRARFDVLVDNLTLEPTNGVVISEDHNKHLIQFKYRNTIKNGLNDFFAYGTQDAMKVYSDVINHIPTLYKDDGVDMCSELFLGAHLFKQNIPVTLKYYKTTLIRG